MRTSAGTASGGGDPRVGVTALHRICCSRERRTRCSLTRPSGHFGNVGSPPSDESGPRVLSYGNNDNTARIWRAEDGRLSATLPDPPGTKSWGQLFPPTAVWRRWRWPTGTRGTSKGPPGRLIGHPLELPVQAISCRCPPPGTRPGWPAPSSPVRMGGVCIGMCAA